ncbi:MAG TPA: hypothetical protein VKY36_06975 [Moheibacter sp.]|nr:hypothetical protein [Moheibacter sp.]
MNKNIYLYQPAIIEPIKVYEFLKENLSEIGFKIKLYSHYEFLSPEKAHHIGDFDLKKLKKAGFEEGIESGIIDSFAVSNHADLSKPDSFVCYLTNEKYVAPGILSIHLPAVKDIENYQTNVQTIFDELIKLVAPIYGFQSKSKTVYKGISYALTGSVFENERANFSSYLSGKKKIDKMRMIYEVNYLTNNQLNHKVNGLKLIELIQKQKDLLTMQKLSKTIHKIECPSEHILEINKEFGKSGFLVSWYDSY